MATRVAMISEHASPLSLLGSEDAGGQNVYVDEVSRNLTGLGYAVDVFTRRDSHDLPEVTELAAGVRVVSVTAGALKSLKKDDFWPHMPAFRDEVRRFISATGSDYALFHGNFWMSGWVACELRREMGTPVVQIFHALGEVKRLQQGQADTSPGDRIEVERRIAAEADRIIAQCPAEVEELTEYYQADAKKIVVIPSAVSTTIFRPLGRAPSRAELGWREDELIVLYVGRLLPRKGIDTLIHALPLVCLRTGRPVRLVIVGGETVEADLTREPEMRRLSALADELAVRPLVTFVGKRQAGSLATYYSAADVFASTPWYEPYGLTPLEAMACGTPAVVSSVGGMKFTIVDGETGYQVPPRDPAALADRLAGVLADSGLRHGMGAAGRARVERYFTWPEVARQVAKLYDEMLGRGEAALNGGATSRSTAERALQPSSESKSNRGRDS